MSTAQEKRIRRLADREGYRVQKLRDDAGYWLIHNGTNGLVLGEAITRGCRAKRVARHRDSVP